MESQTHCTVIECSIFCGDSDYFWDSVAEQQCPQQTNVQYIVSTVYPLISYKIFFIPNISIFLYLILQSAEILFIQETQAPNCKQLKHKHSSYKKKIYESLNEDIILYRAIEDREQGGADEIRRQLILVLVARVCTHKHLLISWAFYEEHFVCYVYWGVLSTLSQK